MGTLVLPEPGPPAVAVLPVSLRRLAVQVGRARRFGDGVQAGPAAALPRPAGRYRRAPASRSHRLSSADHRGL
jgi:hypothetical protein